MNKTAWAHNAGRETSGVLFANANSAGANDLRVLVLTQDETERAVLCAALEARGHAVTACADMAQLSHEIESGAGVAVIDANLVTRPAWAALLHALAMQPAWSDFPLLMLVDDTEATTFGELFDDPELNVLMLERPVKLPTLLGAVRSELRLRHRERELYKRLSKGAPRRENLRAQEDFLQEKHFSEVAINSMPGIFYALDERGAMLRWNTAFEQVSGYSGEEVAKMNALQFFAAEHQPLIAERIGEVFASGQSTADAPFLTKSGAQIPYFFTGKRCHVDGRLALIGLGVNVTEQKRTEERLRDLHALAEQRVAELNAVIESMPDAVYIGDEGGLTKCNRNAFEQLGVSSLEAFKVSLDSVGAKFGLRRPDGCPLSTDEFPFVRALRGEASVEELVVRNVKTGGDFFVRAASSPVVMSGKIVGAVTISSDITERKRAEESLREARDRLSRHAEELEKRVDERTRNLQASIQSLEGVLYHVAHDLRAPLRTMQGFTTILLEECKDLSSEGADYARRISEASSRMDKLIQDLLAYGRLAHVPLKPEKLDLDREVEGVLGHLSAQIQGCRAEVRVKTPLSAVYADSKVLELLLVNLVNNALKFMAREVTPRINIFTEHRDAGMVRLSIQDNGIGIAPEHYERIFKVFERLQTEGVTNSTGIGLAIVRKGVERMGGTAGVESNPGVGSRFWLDLPGA